jgi:hypothetical protein
MIGEGSIPPPQFKHYQNRKHDYFELGEDAYFETLGSFLHSLSYQFLGNSNLDKLLKTGLGNHLLKRSKMVVTGPNVHTHTQYVFCLD